MSERHPSTQLPPTGPEAVDEQQQMANAEAASNPAETRTGRIESFYNKVAGDNVPDIRDLIDVQPDAAAIESGKVPNTRRTAYWTDEGGLKPSVAKVTRQRSNPAYWSASDEQVDGWTAAIGVEPTETDKLSDKELEVFADYHDKYKDQYAGESTGQIFGHYQEYAKKRVKLLDYLGDPEDAAERYAEPPVDATKVAELVARAEAPESKITTLPKPENKAKEDLRSTNPKRSETLKARGTTPARTGKKAPSPADMPTRRKASRGRRAAEAETAAQEPAVPENDPLALFDVQEITKLAGQTAAEDIADTPEAVSDDQLAIDYEAANDTTTKNEIVVPVSGQPSVPTRKVGASTLPPVPGSAESINVIDPSSLPPVPGAAPASAPATPRTRRRATSNGKDYDRPEAETIVKETAAGNPAAGEDDSAPGDHRLKGRELLRRKLEFQKRAAYRVDNYDMTAASARRKTPEDIFADEEEDAPAERKIITEDGVEYVPADGSQEQVESPQETGVRARIRGAFGKVRDLYYAAGSKISTIGAIDPATRSEQIRNRKKWMAVGVGAVAVANLGWNLYKVSKGFAPSGANAAEYLPTATTATPDAVATETVADQAPSYTNQELEFSGDTIWSDSKKILEQNGITNPDNAKIDAIKDRILAHNGITEEQATQLPVGFEYQTPDLSDILGKDSAAVAAEVPAEKTAEQVTTKAPEAEVPAWAVDAQGAAVTPAEYEAAAQAAREEHDKTVEMSNSASMVTLLGAAAVGVQLGTQDLTGKREQLAMQDRIAAEQAEAARIAAEERARRESEDDEDENS